MENVICQYYNATKQIEGGQEINSPCFHYHKGCCLTNHHYRCIEFIRRKDFNLSHTYIEQHSKCRRMFWWSFIQGIQTNAYNAKMNLGSLLHARLALIHADPSIVPEDKVAEQKLLSKECIAKIDANNQEKGTTPTGLLLIKGLVKGYQQLPHASLRGDIEVTRVKQHSGFRLKTITDLVVEGRIYDYKYTGNSDYYTFFICEHQAGAYLMNHPEAKSITFRIVRRPELKKGKNETENELLERCTNDVIKRSGFYIVDKTFHRAEFDFNRISKELSAVSDEISASMDRGIECFRQNRSACYQPFVCDYLPLCESGMGPENLPEVYKKRDVNGGC